MPAHRQHLKKGKMRPVFLGAVCMAMILFMPVSAAASSAGSGLAGIDLGELISLFGGSASSSGSSSSASSADQGAMSGLLELLAGLSGTPIKDCTVASIADQKYTGKEIRPSVKITNGKKTLKRGTDYTLSYKNNKSVGTAKVIIKGKGDYTGTKQVSFHIVKSTSGSSKTNKSSSAKSSKTASSGSSSSKKTDSKSTQSKTFTVKLGTGGYVYNGKARKPSVTVTVRGKTVPKTAYSVTYKNNTKVGNATVTVKGKGEYKGYSAEKTFKITLKKTVLSGASSPEAGRIKASWKKDTQADGYQIEYATNKTFTGSAKRVKAEGGTKQTLLIEDLTSKKQYYVRIRSYKKVGSSNWYSEWSSAKSVKVK